MDMAASLSSSSTSTSRVGVKVPTWDSKRETWPAFRFQFRLTANSTGCKGVLDGIETLAAAESVEDEDERRVAVELFNRRNGILYTWLGQNVTGDALSRIMQVSEMDGHAAWQALEDKMRDEVSVDDIWSKFHEIKLTAGDDPDGMFVQMM